jgi:hypothetical protein
MVKVSFRVSFWVRVRARVRVRVKIMVSFMLVLCFLLFFDAKIETGEAVRKPIDACNNSRENETDCEILAA